MSFAGAIASFSGPIQSKSNRGRLNAEHIDKHDDIVMCTNCFSGHVTQGHILPKELTDVSKVLFPLKPKTAYLPDGDPEDDVEFREWAQKSTIQLDYCCLQSTAYTYVWDNVINHCIKDNIITPCVYRFAYLFLKAMSRSPRIPPGTILYRGTETPFSMYTPDMRFMSFTVNIQVAQRFSSSEGQIGFYKVKQQDYIHGLWLDSEYGTSKFPEHEIVLGPGIFIEPVGQIRNKLQELEIKQMDIHSYFMDHYKPDGDKKFYDIIQTGLILIVIDGIRTVCMSEEQIQHLDSNDRIFQHVQSLLDLDPTIAGRIYVLAQKDEVMTIDTSKATTKSFTLEGLDTYDHGVSYGARRYRRHEEKRDKFNVNCNVFKVLTSDDEIAYCTFEGLCYMKFEMYNIQMLPLDDLPIGTQVMHANGEYKNPIMLSLV